MKFSNTVTSSTAMVSSRRTKSILQPTRWVGGAGVTNSNGTLTCTNATVIATNGDVHLVAGRKYEVKYDYVKTTGANVRTSQSKTDQASAPLMVNESVLAASGTVTFVFTATVNAGITLGASGGTNFTGTISNIRITAKD